MRRAAVALAIVFLPAGAAMARDDDRAMLRQRFGIDLVDGVGAEAWRPDEIAAIDHLMTRLPAALRALGKKSRFGAISVVKSYDTPPPGTSHSAPAFLYWQIRVDLHEASPYISRIGDKAPRELEAAYRTFLERRFVHFLLHAYDASTRTSAEPGWRALSGWRPRQYLGLEIPFFLHEADNQDERGYAAAEGLRDPEEDFVTFGELYLVTPDTRIEESLACRTPDKYRFYRQLFPDYRPALAPIEGKCKTVDAGFLDDLQFIDPVTRQPIAMGPVNAETVEGFELLYATPGVGDAAEIAGHLILRMRLKNNPEAERLGIENPHDLVLSFLADTDADGRVAPAAAALPPGPAPAKPTGAECHRSWLDALAGEDHGTRDFDAWRAILQSLKGLSGGFLTTFDRQTLEMAVHSYTVEQDRNLLRYRLQLSPAQKQALIDRLYAAKKNYKTKYYFFDRNCASILVQLIGEGIGDPEIARFDPFVVPPNALIALLVRKGVAIPVHPSFFGYRKKGFVAQEQLKTSLNRLAASKPGLSWPDGRAITSKKEARRLEAVALLDKITIDHVELRGEIYKLAAFGQDGELAFTDHTQRCEDYTSKVTAAYRALQRRILSSDPNAARAYGVDTNQVIYQAYGETEARDAETGSQHTNLSLVYGGVGERRANGTSGPVAIASMALHRQDLGSTSAQAMQRGTYVTLGEATVAGDTSVTDVHITGLALRKFREHLDDVPTYADESGALGLGLTVLDTRYSAADDRWRSTLVGGELLANLASSRLYDRFLYVSLGTGAEAFDREHIGLIFPVRIEGLWTFDANRAWQLRGESEMRYSILAGRVGRGVLAGASLAYRLGEPNGTEVVARLGASLASLPDPEGEPGPTTSILQLGLEWDRW